MRKIQLLISVAVIGSGSYLPSITWAEGLVKKNLSTDSSSEELTTDEAKVAEPAAEVAEVSSEWDTSWDKMYLYQQGTKITGHYSYSDDKLIGTLEGRLLKGWWRTNGSCGPNQAWNGSYSFLFAEDGQSFIGDWDKCNIPESKVSWNGTLVKGGLNMEEQATDVAEVVSSEWETTWDKLYLNQQGTTITGHYKFSSTHGKLIGTLEGRLLKGWWRTSGSCGPNQAWHGPCSFLFAEDGQSFVGDWGGCSQTHENLNPSNNSWNGTLAKGMLNIVEASSVIEKSPAIPAEKNANDESSAPAANLRETNVGGE